MNSVVVISVLSVYYCKTRRERQHMIGKHCESQGRKPGSMCEVSCPVLSVCLSTVHTIQSNNVTAFTAYSHYTNCLAFLLSARWRVYRFAAVDSSGAWCCTVLQNYIVRCMFLLQICEYYLIKIKLQLVTRGTKILQQILSRTILYKKC